MGQINSRTSLEHETMRHKIHTSSGVHPLRSIAGLRASFHRFAHSECSWDEAWRRMKDWGGRPTATIAGTNPASHCGPFRAELFNSAEKALILFRTPGAFGNAGGHLRPPSLAAVLVGSVWYVLSDGMPLGGVGIVGIL